MPVALATALFVAGAVVSLGTSYVLVTRLERIGERLGLSEALLGVVAALAADAPEITSAVAALTAHQSKSAQASSSARTSSTWPRCWAWVPWSPGASPCTAGWCSSVAWSAAGSRLPAWSRCSA